MRAEATMTRNVVSVPPELSLRLAHDIMAQWGVRHLPVLKGDEVIGILSDRDVLLRTQLVGQERTIANVVVSEAMTKNPVACTKGTPVSSLAETMIKGKIDAVPVTDSLDRLVGLVTSTDLLTLLLQDDEDKNVIPFDFHLRAANAAGVIAAASA